MPSWPRLFRPHAQSEPSGRSASACPANAVLLARPPAEIASQFVLELVVAGRLREPFVFPASPSPLPSWPKLFKPHMNNCALVRIAPEKRLPAAIACAVGARLIESTVTTLVRLSAEPLV